MYQPIETSGITADVWKTLTLAEGESPDVVQIPVGLVLVPLSVWQARRRELINREYEHGWPLGIWLAATDGAEAIAPDVDDFSLIAVEFDEFAVGRYHATVCLLRDRYGYTGELRAIGDVPRGKLTYRHLAGFDYFSRRAGRITSSRPGILRGQITTGP